MKTIRSFLYAIRGVGLSFAEPHMRFHLVAACYVLYFSLFYEMSKAEYSALFAVMALVMTAECINTGIETLCDRVTSQTDERIKNTKDISAGAVLICCVFAGVIGIIIFWDIEVFAKIFEYFSSKITRIIPLIVSVFISILFIKGYVFSTGKGKRND